MEARCIVISVLEISLSHGQYFGRLASEKAAIGPHFVGLGVYFHARRGIIQNHRTLADLARVGDRKEFLCKAKRSRFLEQRLAHKCHGAFRQRATERTEHRPVVFGLRRRNGGVRISHDGSRNCAALKYHAGFHPEKGWIPDTNIGKLSKFNRTDICRNTLSYRGIDRVFRYISSSPEVVVLALFLCQVSELFLHFVPGLPGSGNHLSYTAHGLTV